ncbi:hypothetical protein CK203_108354 [Vitis vinifera]|uniref:Uncharacterized protein n=1 Tax=Vitis vinifera TaxID=29760 RepID=A0A438C5C0_VITVI|nr:hypothetical protein CK203_108354 [Vitis vinifera]
MECIKRKFCMDPLNSPETWDAKFNLDVPYSSRLQQQQQHASSIGSGGPPSIGPLLLPPQLPQSFFLFTWVQPLLVPRDHNYGTSTTNPSYPIVHGQVYNWDVMENLAAGAAVLAHVTGYTTSKCEMTEEDLGSFTAD